MRKTASDGSSTGGLPSDRWGVPSSGFTLIELLVVISIIALLISILLPSLGRAREMGRRAVCSSNMRQIGTGFLQYSEDFEGWFPVKPSDRHTDPTVEELATVQTLGGGTSFTDFWGPQFAGMIRDIVERNNTHDGASVPLYVADPKMLICPSDTTGNALNAVPGDPNPPQLPVRPADSLSKIQINAAAKVKNYSYMYVALWRNDDRSDYFMLGDESDRNDEATNSLTGLTTEDNHGRQGINAMFTDTHVEWAGTRGGDVGSLQELAGKLWGPATHSRPRWRGTNGGNRSSEVQTTD
ncbi:MAG: DUF1559 domain-containing protein [Phycisphaerae bacterium]